MAKKKPAKKPAAKRTSKEKTASEKKNAKKKSVVYEQQSFLDVIFAVFRSPVK